MLRIGWLVEAAAEQTAREPEMVNHWGEPRYSTQNACYASMDAEFTTSQTRTVAYDFVETAAFAPGGGALPPRQAQLTA